MNRINKTVLVAMSGGVDSAVAAYITKKTYTDISAATLTMGKYCFNDNELNDAKIMAEILGLKHSVCNVEDDFYKYVIDYFTKTYLAGKTPNPCVECNKHIKFGALFNFAQAEKRDLLATGHYASIIKDGNGRYLLQKAVDIHKDQTYMLWRLNQSQLSKIIFPLSDLTKKEIRDIAAENGIISANKKDSQDICFVPDGNYINFIKIITGCSEFTKGNFVDESGNILGIHNGIVNYTIGQRKGLGMAFGKPMFVKSKSQTDNTVTISAEDKLFSKKAVINDINLIACDTISSAIKADVKIRYSQQAASATLCQTAKDEIVVEFDSPQRAVAPGQSLVIYDGNTVIGGGVIQ